MSLVCGVIGAGILGTVQVVDVYLNWANGRPRSPSASGVQRTGEEPGSPLTDLATYLASFNLDNDAARF